MYSLHQITAWSNIDEEVCPKFPHTALACIENEQAAYISLVHKIMELIILGYIVYLICTSTSTKLGRVLVTRTNTSVHTKKACIYQTNAGCNGVFQLLPNMQTEPHEAADVCIIVLSEILGRQIYRHIYTH
jgi:hypothetical protein